MRISILQQGLIIVVVPMILQIIAVALLFFLQGEVERELVRADRSRKIIETSLEAVNDLQKTVVSLHKDEDFQIASASKQLDVFFPKTVKQLEEIRTLVADDPDESRIVNNLDRQFRTLADKLFAARKTLRQGDFAGAKQLLDECVNESKVISPKMSDDLFALIAQEKIIEARSPTIQQGLRFNLQLASGFIVFLNILSAFALSVIFNRFLASRIKTLSTNVLHLASNKPLLPLGGNDELNELDRAFKNMAAELNEAQEHERALVDNARELITSINIELKFVSVNDASITLLQRRPADLAGARLISIVVPEDVEYTVEYFAKARSKESSSTLENRLVSRSGSVRDFQWSVQWSEKEQSYFCVAHDVTQAKQVERMKQEFVAMVSHDLRTPLTSIQAFHELLESGAYGQMTDRGQENLASVDESLTRLMTLVNDLLDIEKLESGMMPLTRRMAKVIAVVRHSVDAVANFAAKKNIQVEMQVDDDLVIFADEDRVCQVLINLLSNAIKFSANAGTVIVRAHEADEVVSLAVEDFGRGIPPENLSSVFERFVQVRASDGKHRQGSGLGLAISKAIVEQHGGSIKVESVLNKGTKFTFSLPANQHAQCAQLSAESNL